MPVRRALADVAGAGDHPQGVGDHCGIVAAFVDRGFASALKHDISPDDVIQAAERRCGSNLSTRTGRPHGRCASDSLPARLLETVVLVFEGGDEIVIHATPARKRYLDLPP